MAVPVGTLVKAAVKIIAVTVASEKAGKAAGGAVDKLLEDKNKK